MAREHEASVNFQGLSWVPGCWVVGEPPSSCSTHLASSNVLCVSLDKTPPLSGFLFKVQKASTRLACGCCIFILQSSSSDRAPTHKWAVENSLFGRHSPPCPSVFLHKITLPVQVQFEHQHPPHWVQGSTPHQWTRTLVLRAEAQRCSRMQTLTGSSYSRT